MDRDDLARALEQGETLKRIGERTGLEVKEIRKLAGEFGLPMPAEIRRRQVADALAEGRRSVVRLCPRHGRTEFAIVGSTHRLHCKRCRAEAVGRRRRKVKQLLVEEAGGRCLICGFSDHLAALEFHHVDPRTKSFGLAQRGITRSIEAVRREARKCVLVCANCHAAIEVGELEVPVQLPRAIAPNPQRSDYTIA
jgi:hypothetical protein